MKRYDQPRRLNAVLKPVFAFAAAALAALLACHDARGDVLVTNTPPIDAFVTTGPSGNLSSSNYGGAGALAISAPGLAKGEFQSVMQFNLAGDSAALNAKFGAGLWTVESVTLLLTAQSPNNGIFNSTAAGNFNVSLMQNNSWTEGGGNPNTPSASGINYNTLTGAYINNAVDQGLGAFSFNGATTGTATYSLTLSSGLVADLMAGTDASLRLFAADSQVSYLFNSRTGGATPELIVDVVPEPGSMALGAMGLAIFAIWRRVKR